MEHPGTSRNHLDSLQRYWKDIAEGIAKKGSASWAWPVGPKGPSPEPCSAAISRVSENFWANIYMYEIYYIYTQQMDT